MAESEPWSYHPDGSPVYSLADIIRKRAAATPAAIALAEAGRLTSFAELDRRSSQVVRALQAGGVRPGGRVACIGASGPEFVEVLYGAAKCRAIFTAVNNRLSARQVLVAGSRIMKRYWRKPEKTAEVMLPGGWLRTGDGGSFDADGFLYLHDRLKDMIVSGGENVYPAEVESIITGHPAVAEVAVVGMPSAEWGRIPLRRRRPELRRARVRGRALRQDPGPPGALQVPGRRLFRPVPGPHCLRQAPEAGHPRQPELGCHPLVRPGARVTSLASATHAPGTGKLTPFRQPPWRGQPRGFSSVGRALAWHARGQGFESPKLHQVRGLLRPGHDHPGASRGASRPLSL